MSKGDFTDKLCINLQPEQPGLLPIAERSSRSEEAVLEKLLLCPPGLQWDQFRAEISFGESLNSDLSWNNRTCLCLTMGELCRNLQ